MQRQRPGSGCLLKWRIRKFIFLRNVTSRAHKSPYAVLGVASKADIKEIKERFYKLSKEHHPDISKDASSMEKFREIAEAYETLSNPELRSKYDQESGLTRQRSPLSRPAGRKFEGGWSPKGSFVNGQWVDDEPTPQMRNIEYDLSPERMERVWARYRSRWEKIEEVERSRELERKREEFRRKIDEKRARMAQMTEAEREEFLFKLRYLRPDAADPEESFINGSQGTRDGAPEREENEGSMGKKPRMEDIGDASTNAGDASNNMKQKVREKERQAAKEKIILEEMQREEKMKRAFFEEQMRGSGSGWEAGQDQSRNFRNPFMGSSSKGQTFGENDPFSSGINREDPGDLGSYASAWEQGKGGKRVRKAWQGWKDPGARMNGDRMHSVKHGIQRKPRMSFGEVLVIAITISFVALSYVEYSN